MKSLLKIFKKVDEDFTPENYEDPKYDLQKDNHDGYHFHILVLKEGKYLLSDYAITIVGGVACAFFHSKSENNIHFDKSTLQSKKFLDEIEPLLRTKIRNILDDEWKKFSKTPMIPLFHI